MAKFPKIQRSCPIASSLDDYLVGDMCTSCNRQVNDLNLMNDSQRAAFLGSCSEEVCVSYTLPKRVRASAVALSAVLMTLPSAAQDSTPLETTVCPVDSSTTCGDVIFSDEYEILITGTIGDPSALEYIDTEEDLAMPELPVVYEEVDY